MKIAYVLYPDFTALNPVGPYEVISRWPNVDVHFLARSLEPVRCDAGLTVIPTGSRRMPARSGSRFGSCSGTGRYEWLRG
jgi:hypothetical protein